MRRISLRILAVIAGLIIAATACKQPSLWDLAKENESLLRVSTLFTAQDVRNKLSSDSGIDSAILWCRDAGITRVFLESFRDGYTADHETLLNAKGKFEISGIEASGCVTTTMMGKPSSAGSIVSCYTNESTHKELVRIFEYTASMFSVIMIDDFLFTTCACDECRAACGTRSLEEYRRDLMNEISREYILKPAKAINPDVKVINKFPLWYDNFHVRGYDVLGETESYDMIWVGTETRDNDFVNFTPGLNKPQYGAYFIMRWLGEIGGEKTGGGWIDALGTTPDTYLEQARQTVLAGAREIMLFSYGGLNRVMNIYGQRKGTGIANLEALKAELPGLYKLAAMIDNKSIKGVHAVKPPNSDPHSWPDTVMVHAPENADAYIFDFVGMLGIPLVPMEKIDVEAEAAFFSNHALKDPDFKEKLAQILAGKKPVLVTSGLAAHLENTDAYENLAVLNVGTDPKNILKLSRETLNPIRNKLLEPFGIKIDAPALVALYLIGDNIIVIENFSDQDAEVTLETGKDVTAEIKLTLPEDSDVESEFARNKLYFRKLPGRGLVALEHK
ncbi:MAG TPA: hypothetical protein VI583_12255 [Cyclobacteriaceae bacterium]|nr:hypothetical protein [Cyclobacteriaceae bacterium]